MTNIIDGMDASRFNSANTQSGKKKEKNVKKEDKKMPMVLRNLKNGS